MLVQWGSDMDAVVDRVAAGEEASEGERAALAAWLLGRAGQREAFGLTPANVDTVVAARLGLLPAVCRALGEAPIEAAGYLERVATTATEAFLVHLPLAQRLIRGSEAAEGRWLVAVAGVPGSGKTVFAAQMARVVRAVSPALGVVAIGLDGYHYPNARLAAAPAPPGVAEPGPMALYKGAPFTFDAGRLAGDLRRLRCGAALSLPAYDRAVHEPVEGRLDVAAGDRLAIVEGNYLLCREPGWQAVSDQFDLRIFLELPPGANREPLVARHMRGGRSREDAERHYERTDRPNAERVAGSAEAADIVIELSPGYRVVGLRRGEARGRGVRA